MVLGEAVVCSPMRLASSLSIPFFVVPNVYTGPIAARLGGVDLGWLVSLAAAALTYLAVSCKFDPAMEAAAVGRGNQVENTARISAVNS